jgi:hypothetical protein
MHHVGFTILMYKIRFHILSHLNEDPANGDHACSIHPITLELVTDEENILRKLLLCNYLSVLQAMYLPSNARLVTELK